MMRFLILLLVSFCSSVQCNKSGTKDIFAQRFAHLKNVMDKNSGLNPKLAPAVTKLDCAPGYTGPDCSNPICYNMFTIQFHDGNENYGDDIDWERSQSCNDTFQFPLEMTVGDLYMSVIAFGPGAPSGTLFGPSGNEVLPCQILGSTGLQWVAKYCNILENKAGTYSFRLRNRAPTQCVYSAQATSSFVVDGGFVSDPRDDNVQRREPSGNNGIERDPLYGVPSYFAFALNRQNMAANFVAIYANNVLSKTFTVTQRYNCGAPNIAGPYSCDQSDIVYQVKIYGTDASGNSFQRFYFFTCLAGGNESRRRFLEKLMLH